MAKSLVALTSIALGVSAGAAYEYSFVVNDFDDTLVSSANWEEGWYTMCHDSYGDVSPVDFHVDMAGKHGEVSATYAVGRKIDIPGCYQLDEWHPGVSHQCARSLPTNAKLTINTMDGPVKEFVDQSQNGGKWNKVGVYVMGSQSDLVYSNNGGDTECAANMVWHGKCWMLYDAFKLTYLNETCDGLDHDLEMMSMEEQQDAGLEHPAFQCSRYLQNLKKTMDECDMPRNCGEWEAAGAYCHKMSVDLLDRYGANSVNCLMHDTSGETAGREETVSMLYSCPMNHTNTEEDLKVMTSNSQAMQGANDRFHRMHRATDTCDKFATMAKSAYDACEAVTCCKEVITEDMCNYFATSLFSWYSSASMETCMQKTKNDPAMAQIQPERLQHLTSCAIKGEMHNILYKKSWEPDCVPFEEDFSISQDAFEAATKTDRKMPVWQKATYFIFMTGSVILVILSVIMLRKRLMGPRPTAVEQMMGEKSDCGASSSSASDVSNRVVALCQNPGSTLADMMCATADSDTKPLRLKVDTGV